MAAALRTRCPGATRPRPCHERLAAPRVQRCRTALHVSVAEAPATEVLVETLTQAAKKPGSVPAADLLSAVCNLEKKKAPLPDDWYQLLSRPDKRWRLIYTAGTKDVLAFNKGQKGGTGGYFPMIAAQKFGADDTFENGVFLGPVAHLTFKGPCATKGKQLSFDVHTMYLGVGPWRTGIPLKKDGKPLDQVEPSEVKKLPFFIYAYIDENIIVARGRSGGLALWVAADTKWQATAGVLQVYK